MSVAQEKNVPKPLDDVVIDAMRTVDDIRIAALIEHADAQKAKIETLGKDVSYYRDGGARAMTRELAIGLLTLANNWRAIDDLKLDMELREAARWTAAVQALKTAMGIE